MVFGIMRFLMEKLSLWKPAGLTVAFVGATIGQWIFRTLTVHEFRHAAYMTNMAASLVMLPVFSLPLVLCQWKCGGFLPEMKSRVIRRSFVSIGCCNAIAQIMQTFSFFDTPVTLQASLGHLIVPFVVAFVMTDSPSLYRNFSRRALVGCAFIVVGSLGHISVTYLSSPASDDANQIFWRAIFLLSFIPLAISSLSQQQTYSIRRLNVFHFLFHATLFQLFFQIILLPLNCIKGIDSFQWSHMLAAVWNFVTCISGLGNSTGICPNPWATRYFLFSYIGFTIASQLLQIVVVRSVSFKGTSYAILCIPTLTFTLFISLTSTPTSGLLQTILGPTAATRLLDSQGPSSFPFTVAVLHALVLLGSTLYRLDRQNNLEKDFVLPADALFHEHRDIFALFAPFLQTEGGNSGCCRHIPKPTPTGSSELGDEPLPSVLSQQQLQELNSTAVLHLGRPSTRTSMNWIFFFFVGLGATIAAQTLRRQVEKKETSGTESPISLPFYLPSPMPQYRPLPTMVRPVLMNCWSGCILCEYTDYKRLNDCVAPSGWRSSIPTPTLSDDPSAFEPNPLLCRVWEQYTLLHLGTLSCTEQALRKLYAYQSIGPLAAASIAVQVEQQSTPGSLSSSSKTHDVPGGVTEEESDASSLDA